MPKIIRILRSLSMKIFCKFPTVNISKLNFWLIICIAKNFIWTTLKVIFSIFRFFCSLRFQIYKYCPIITNHTSMEILFIQLSDDVYISISQNWPLWLVLWSRVTYVKYVWRASSNQTRATGSLRASVGEPCFRQILQVLHWCSYCSWRPGRTRGPWAVRRQPPDSWAAGHCDTGRASACLSPDEWDPETHVTTESPTTHTLQQVLHNRRGIKKMSLTNLSRTHQSYFTTKKGKIILKHK